MFLNITLNNSLKNKRDLINQIKAQNITNYKFLQLGILFISLYYIYLKLINYNINNTTR